MAITIDGIKRDLVTLQEMLKPAYDGPACKWGVCGELETRDLLRGAISTWPMAVESFTLERWSYPVPHPTLDAHTAFNDDDGDMFNGKYGENRRSLVRHMMVHWAMALAELRAV